MKDDELKVDAGTGRAPSREELAAVEAEEGCEGAAEAAAEADVG